MPISPDYYPPFDPRELPPNPSQRMKIALDALYRASVEVHRSLYRLTLLHEITRDRFFVAKINRTPLAYPLLTVRSGLAYATVVSINAMFETGDSSASLRRILRTLTDRREEQCIRDLHAQGKTGIDVNLALIRLRQLQKRLNSGEIDKAVGRLMCFGGSA